MARTNTAAPLILNNVTKTYGAFRGIDSITLEVKAGEVFGFLGPNGAGKTTAIRTIMNFLHPSSGAISLFGLDSVRESTQVKARVGYLAGDFELYDTLTGEQYLEFIAHLRGVTDVRQQIDDLAGKLEATLSKKIGTLSRGNMQKVALIAALLHDPDLLILDEPTTGLDPLMQNRFYEIVRERVKRGKTVFMSSHILSEVQTVCDRVGFMKEGKLVEVVDIHTLQKDRQKEVVVTSSGAAKKITPPAFKNIEVITSTKNELRFITGEPSKTLLKWLAGQPVRDVTIQNVSLEDMFLKRYGSGEKGE